MHQAIWYWLQEQGCLMPGSLEYKIQNTQHHWEEFQMIGNCEPN